MQSPPFSALAGVYDDLMLDVPYGAWAEFLLRTAREHGVRAKSVLELGCGTGALTVRLEAHAERVVAVDASEAMLERARARLRQSEVLHGDMRTTPSSGSFDLVVAVFDVVNNLLEDGELEDLAGSVLRRTAPGGLWIFDVNTPSGLESPWEGGVMEAWVDDLHCRFEHRWDAKRQRAEVHAWWENDAGSCEEFHRQRPYAAAEVEACLLQAGFATVRCSAHPDGGEPEPDEPRLWVVARAPS